MRVIVRVAAGCLPLFLFRSQNRVIMSMQPHPWPEVPASTAKIAKRALLARLGALGLVGAGMRQRTDSTHVLGRIRDLNRPGAGWGECPGGAGGAGSCRAGLAGRGDRRVLAAGVRAADR